MTSPRRAFAFALLTLLAVAARAAGACEWLSYDPETESARGTLTIRAYDDPREVSRRKLKFMVLELARPVCVRAKPSSDFDVEEQDVQRIQIVANDAATDKALHSLLRKKVVITGKLFHEFSALHVEKVLIRVIAVKRDDAER